jgi:hypothetical protein
MEMDTQAEAILLTPTAVEAVRSELSKHAMEGKALAYSSIRAAAVGTATECRRPHKCARPTACSITRAACAS